MRQKNRVINGVSNNRSGTVSRNFSDLFLLYLLFYTGKCTQQSTPQLDLCTDSAKSLCAHTVEDEYIYIPCTLTHGGELYKVLVGKPERKRPLGRPRSRWEDNIKMDLHEAGWEGHGLDLPGSR